MSLTALLLSLQAISSAAAAPRSLSLTEAVALALRVDPNISEARIQQDRSQLARLQAELNRISVSIDGRLQEIWSKQNIPGPIQFYDCQFGASRLNYQFGFNRSTVSDDSEAALMDQQQACVARGGQVRLSPEQSPETTRGLLNLALNINIPVFAGFRIDATVKRARRFEEAAVVNVRQQRKDIALAMARAYWAVRRIALLAEVQQRALDRMSEAEAVTQGRVRAGLAPPIDHNRAILRRLQQVSTLEDLIGQQRESAAQLGVSLGITDDLLLTDVPNVPEAAPPPVEQLLADARGGRPEILTAKLQVAAQHENVRIARAGFFPQLSLNGLYQYGNSPFQVSSGASLPTSALANPFNSLAGSVQLYGLVNWNFFNMFQTYTATRDAIYERSRLVEEQRRFERIVDADVRTAHAKVLHLNSRRVPLAEARNVAANRSRQRRAAARGRERAAHARLARARSLTRTSRRSHTMSLDESGSGPSSRVAGSRVQRGDFARTAGERGEGIP